MSPFRVKKESDNISFEVPDGGEGTTIEYEVRDQQHSTRKMKVHVKVVGEPPIGGRLTIPPELRYQANGIKGEIRLKDPKKPFPIGPWTYTPIRSPRKRTDNK